MLLYLKQRTNLISIFQRFLEHSESDGFVLSSGRMSDMMWAMRQHGQVHNQAITPAGLTWRRWRPSPSSSYRRIRLSAGLNWTREMFLDSRCSGLAVHTEARIHWAIMLTQHVFDSILHHPLFSSLLHVISCLGLYTIDKKDKNRIQIYMEGTGFSCHTLYFSDYVLC